MDGKELDRCCNVGKLVSQDCLTAWQTTETGDHTLQSVKQLIKNIYTWTLAGLQGLCNSNCAAVSDGAVFLNDYV